MELWLRTYLQGQTLGPQNCGFWSGRRQCPGGRPGLSGQGDQHSLETDHWSLGVRAQVGEAPSGVLPVAPAGPQCCHQGGRTLSLWTLLRWPC